MASAFTEDLRTDCKSLRLVTGKTTDWPAVAHACVCFANGVGGRLLIGIEDGASGPPPGQIVPPDVPERLEKRVRELTVNVPLSTTVRRARNGGQYLEVAIEHSSEPAGTRDGRFFIRVGDTCLPILPEDVMRLADERSRPWEKMNSCIPHAEFDPQQLAALAVRLRASSRVNESVKEKRNEELLIHYELSNGKTLTRLGVLLIGTKSGRADIGVAPFVQVLKYDEFGQKINKWLWDDGHLSPIELVDRIWQEVSDFRESYEIAEGMIRRNVPAYDEKVVRELLVNAFVHRPYTQGGDVELRLYPDRLEIINPGRLCVGVTPENMLHASKRRNKNMAKIFFDLHMMESEGSGIDLLYDRLLSKGRPPPVIKEGADWVTVTIMRGLDKPEIMRLVEYASKRYDLTQRERIALGLLAQVPCISLRELLLCLELQNAAQLDGWLGRLPLLNLVQRTGRTQGVQYSLTPGLLDHEGTALRSVVAQRQSAALLKQIKEDLARHGPSKIGEIRPRVGMAHPKATIRKALKELLAEGAVEMQGDRKAARYALKP